MLWCQWLGRASLAIGDRRWPVASLAFVSVLCACELGASLSAAEPAAPAATTAQQVQADALVAQAEEVDLVPAGQAAHQVIGTQLVALLQGIGHAGKDNQQLHAFSRDV